MNMFDLTGRVALVTGAAKGGLGHHSAIGLAEAGADVFVSDLESRSDDMSATVDSVRSLGRQAESHPCDVTSEQQVEELVEQASSRLGRVDILVHHSGVMLRKDAIETSLEEWQRIIDINLTGTWLMNRAVAPGMLESGWGRIVNTSTLYSNIVGPLPESAYYASKAGVSNLTRGLAAEWGSGGINVNCLAPGVFFPTNMTEPLRDSPDRLDWMRDRTLLGRLGDPETDLKGVVVFLASEASAYMTGQVVFVDGGWTAK